MPAEACAGRPLHFAHCEVVRFPLFALNSEIGLRRPQLVQVLLLVSVAALSSRFGGGGGTPNGSGDPLRICTLAISEKCGPVLDDEDANHEDRKGRFNTTMVSSFQSFECSRSWLMVSVSSVK